MTPHSNGRRPENIVRLSAPERPAFSASPPRLFIIGGGNRGIAYSKAIQKSTNGVLVGVAEPVAVKRRTLGRRFIWASNEPAEGQEFEDWRQFVVWEQQRRERAARGDRNVPEGVDAVLVCVQDQMHAEVVLGLTPLNLHILCEKPLAQNLDSCIAIYRSLLPDSAASPAKIFSIGHVLRYSPHNILLRRLLLEDKVIGEVMAVNHTEPVGWNHFTHSYVRGNWRRESTSAPSLLAKSCHDMDLLYWLLAAPASATSNTPVHIPKEIGSSGSLQNFRKARKPKEAGTATNCLSCAYESSCQFSAKRVYASAQLESRNQKHWVSIVCPEIEEAVAAGGPEAGREALFEKLAEDYGPDVSEAEVSKRNWYGRCVYEADNDVCDNQTVTLAWEDGPIATGAAETAGNTRDALTGRCAKTAHLHMVAFTHKVCQRYTHIYGADGEIYADGSVITVQDFRTGKTMVHYPPVPEDGGHGDGDEGLARQFVLAVDRVKNYGMDVAEAQKQYIGCSLTDIVMSHSMVFAAEEARLGHKIVDFPAWWKRRVLPQLEA